MILLIARLQKLPFYPEILRHLTLGQSLRSLARWLTQQRIDGPAGRWTVRYWVKLLSPLEHQVRVAKERQERADRRASRHPAPPTPQQIETTLATITDTPMLLANILPNDTQHIVQQAEEVLDQITSERFLKLALIQVATRIDSAMRLELQTQVRQRDVHQDIKNLIDGADKLMKLEMLQGRFNLKPATPENAIDQSDIAAQLRQFDEVDRNLIRSATMKVIHMIEEEAAGKYDDGPGAEQRLNAE